MLNIKNTAGMPAATSIAADPAATSALAQENAALRQKLADTEQLVIAVATRMQKAEYSAWRAQRA